MVQSYAFLLSLRSHTWIWLSKLLAAFNFGEFQNLVELSIWNNTFSGLIISSFGKILALMILDMLDNQLNVSLPKNFGSLSNLLKVYNSRNLCKGIVSEVHFANLTNLSVFHGFGNSLTLRVCIDYMH